MTQPIIEEAAMGLVSSSNFSGRNLAIADLGCASGPNTLFAVSELIKALDKVRRKLGHVSLEFQVFLNDLPGNDFNSVFRLLVLSELKGARTGARRANSFCIIGKESQGPSTVQCIYLLELLSDVLNQMAFDGLIDQTKLDSFNLPIYMPSPMEVQVEVQKQGTFTIERLEVWESSWNPHEGEVDLPESLQDGGRNVARCIRAVMEPLLVRQFGPQRKIMDEIFLRYGVILSNWMAMEEANYVNVIVSLTKP
ncbi:unnamed protein product [Linum tenue]|nr:unnamed protein product [Linum tenue]